MLKSCDGNCRFKEGKNGMYCTRCGEYKGKSKGLSPYFFILLIFFASPLLFLLGNLLNNEFTNLQYTNTTYTRENTERF